MTALKMASSAPEPEPNVRIELITPDRAREYLGQNTHNRTLRARVVAAYASDMKAGDWRWNGESIKFDVDGILLDGQHRLAAIVEAGVAVRVLVIRGLPSETQETMDGGAKRKYSDVLHLRGETSYVTLAAMVRSIAAWEDGHRRASTHARAFTNAQLNQTLEKYPWIRDGLTVVNRLTTKAGIPASSGGLLYWLFMQIDPEDAEFFFERVCSDQGHQAGDPAYELRRVVQASREVRGTRNVTYLNAVGIKAWNKYREGEQVGQLKYRAGGANPEKFPEPK